MRYVPLLLLAGCAMTATELSEQQPDLTFQTGLAPLQAAECLGRAAEAYPKLLAMDRFVATWHERPGAGGFEVLVWRNVRAPLVVAHVVPVANGATVRMWQQNLLTDTDLPTEMAKRCGARI